MRKKQKQKNMNYRKDIQILRGVAVLLVVLFHLDLAHFKSGFLGVDIFFVISGFLMAILYDPNEKLIFLKRRALRLLPAYFMTIILTLIGSIFILSPNEVRQISEQSAYANLFASNIGYWMQNSYFSKSDFTPLLHLWSLGVEIQYYLIIPILFYFLRISKIHLSLIALGSLSLCFLMVTVSPKTAFFMMPLRIWEFVIGYGIAKHLTSNGMPKNNTPIIQGIGTFAFLLIVAIPLIDIKGDSQSILLGHPGLYALIATLSAGIVLCAGINKTLENSLAGTIFEIIGKYSYSIYLVHFPVIVLFLYKPFSGTNLSIESNFDLLLITIIIILLSIAMYHLIEVKLRSSSKINYILFSSPIVILILIALSLSSFNILYNKKEMYIFDALQDRSSYRCGKIFRLLNPTSIACNITPTQTNHSHKVLLVGNSHADAIKTAFANAADNLKTSTYFIVPNDPMMKGSIITPTIIIEEAIKLGVTHIVIHYSSNDISASTISSITRLAKKRGIFISFIMPVPVWNVHIPKALWNNLEYNTALPTQNIDHYHSKLKPLRSSIEKLNYTNFRIYHLANYFCSNDCNFIDNNGIPLYFDNHHLTLTGARKLSTLFTSVIVNGKKNRAN